MTLKDKTIKSIENHRLSPLDIEESSRGRDGSSKIIIFLLLFIIFLILLGLVI